MSSYDVSQYLLDRENIHDTITKLASVATALVACPLSLTS
jgi:hypothetical protein